MNHQQLPKPLPKFEEIRELAYYLWREANGTSGQDLNFWLQAERQLMMRPPVQGPPLPETSPTVSGHTAQGGLRTSSKRASPTAIHPRGKRAI